MSIVMSWIKYKKKFTILFINVFVFLFLFLIAEFVGFFINPLNRESFRITCNYDWVMYNYCPNAIDVKKNTDSDGGNFVYTYTNDFGQRVKNPSAEYASNPDYVFVGDSFIQAEEMDFSETFYGRLSDAGFQVSAIGYSSWNVIEYREAINKLAHENTNYHVFLMPNDITPAYYRSVYKEKLASPVRRMDTKDVSFKDKLLRTYYNSLTKKVLDVANAQSKKTEVDTLKPIGTNLFENKHVMDCKPLLELDESQKQSLGFDYAVFSKHRSCWPQLHVDAVNQAVEELELLFNDVKKLNSTLRIYMIPPGWAFINQNTGGRKGNSYYFFDNMTRVTTEPLSMYLAERLPDIDFISLESLMSNWMIECTNCKDLFYYPDDGHWTPETHRRIADYLEHSLIQ